MTGRRGCRRAPELLFGLQALRFRSGDVMRLAKARRPSVDLPSTGPLAEGQPYYTRTWASHAPEAQRPEVW